jgi:hypothetical protein
MEVLEADAQIDSLAHTVTFGVTYGAGVQPKSDLNQRELPAPPTCKQRIRTRTLLIAIGPEEENKTNIENVTVINATAPH